MRFYSFFEFIGACVCWLVLLGKTRFEEIYNPKNINEDSFDTENIKATNLFIGLVIVIVSVLYLLFNIL